MVTFAIMIVTPILAQKATIERLLSSEWSRVVVRVLYYVLPKTSDVSVIIRHMILNQPIESWMPVWSTALFGVVVLGLGLWRFQRRSF
jgi:ABC-type transport system involved in multi-copper enzyme maturation permease subunit